MFTLIHESRKQFHKKNEKLWTLFNINTNAELKYLNINN